MLRRNRGEKAAAGNSKRMTPLVPRVEGRSPFDVNSMFLKDIRLSFKFWDGSLRDFDRPGTGRDKERWGTREV